MLVFERTFALMPVNSSHFYPYWQLITYQFMHGGISHLFFNMLALWMFGSELEQLWGSQRFLIYYLLCGLGGGALHLWVDASVPTIGASGAIMGVLAAFGMSFPNRPVMMFPLFIPIPAKFFVLIYALIDLYSGFSGSSDGVAHFAHVGGAITGVLLLKFGDKVGIFDAASRLMNSAREGVASRDHTGRKVVEVRYRDVSSAQSVGSQRMFHGASFFHKGEHITEDVVNGILDKISASGYDSLSQREKDILIEISRRMNA